MNIRPPPNYRAGGATGDRSFGCAAPNLWNDLPSRIQQADSIGSFKKLLKTHLFRKAYYNI
jgi:hypothetical protein